VTSHPTEKNRMKSDLSNRVDADLLFEALCKTCDVLETLGCEYFLAGGTLLGACRSGDVIPHDIDFDLDCLSESEAQILGAAELFAEKGLQIEVKMSMVPKRMDTLEQTNRPLDTRCIVVWYRGQHVGDICLYTLFSDGIARRFDPRDRLYSNPKMAIPDWYYSGEEYLSIRGRKFRSVREPELVLEKIYGSDWRIPMRPGQFADGRTSVSGSIPDADIEQLMLHALDRGWMASRHGAPQWQGEIDWIGWPPVDGREWILNHEPMIHDKLAQFVGDSELLGRLETLAPSQRFMLLKLVAARAIQAERAREKEELERQNTFSHLAKRMFYLLPMPGTFRNVLVGIYRNLRKAGRR